MGKLYTFINQDMFGEDYWDWSWIWDEEGQVPLEADDIWELSESAMDLLDRWNYDYGAGYDLRDGRMKGLAARYNKDEMFNLLTSNKEYTRRI